MTTFTWIETPYGWTCDFEGVGRLYVRRVKYPFPEVAPSSQQFEGYVAGRRYCIVQTADLAKAACEAKALAVIAALKTRLEIMRDRKGGVT